MKRLKNTLACKWFYLLILFLTIGYSYIYIFVIPHNSKLTGKETSFVGIITNMKISGDLLSLQMQGMEKIVGNYYFKTQEEKEKFCYKLGDKIKVYGELTIPINNTIPNGFNYKSYLQRKKIYYVIQIKKIVFVSQNRNPIYYVRNQIEKRIDTYKSKTYLKAFIIGDDSLIESDINDSYQKNGISHLLVTSGMHISLFSAVILFVLRIMKRGEKASTIITVLFLVFYLLLSGITASLSRAVVLFIILGINRLLKLNLSTLKSFIITLCFIVMSNPFLIYDVGFEFSFIISFYLILLGSKIKKAPYIKRLIFASKVSFLIGLPICLYYFYQINGLSILYNMLFVPLVSLVIFPLSLITLILPLFDNLLFLLITLMEKISLILADFSITQIIFMKPTLIWIIVYYFVVTIYLYSNKKVALFLVLIVLMYQYFKPELFPGSYFMMLDVGQGDCLLVRSNNNYILIDTGGRIKYEKEEWQNGNTESIIESRIIPLLKSLGIRKLNYLVLTHGDYDHMGDAVSLVNNFRVEKVIFNNDSYNKLEQELIKVLKHKQIEYYRGVKDIYLENNKLLFLNTKIYNNENDNSNVIYFSINDYSFLLMGDAGITKEKDILKKYSIDNIDYLKIGHHGSDTSTSKYFIDRINPKNCLISVGKDNRYDHPKKSVLQTIEQCNVYRTDIMGSIEIGKSIKTHRP